MNFRGPILLILFIISAFLFRGQLILEKTIAGGTTYHTCELKASYYRHTDNDRVLLDENGPAHVLHFRLARTVHFLKSNSIITSTILGVCQYLKLTFYTSDDPFIPSTELLLFPHHTFW